ncbi:hemolysin family protein [Metabacillus sp. HB246100]|uniref:hemolysin family protein n=1 Tax=Bacillus weihaiensis TaxID=1547283 RepID=UPI002356E137|nr:hemolysin family protein [Bacillus weihaiensis]
MTITINIVLIIILIALTGFFVATEFAIVKVRSSKIEQFIVEERKGALAAKKVVSHLDEYLSACQLGITVTALGLGWLGEPTVEKIIHPLFETFQLNESLSHLLTFGLAFAIVTFLHVVIGELAPKTIAIQKAELITLTFATPIMWFYKMMYPFIWFLNGSARLFVRLFGIKTASEHEIAHSEEELRILLSESFESGEINQNELDYVNNIFEFDERIAKEVMVPRTEIVSLSLDNSFEEVLEIIATEKYTRYPVVVNGDRDHIIGFINIKELLTRVVITKEVTNQNILEPFINPVIRVIETMAIHELLVKMQKERTHIAILIDEYGGTSGLVTVEDILEEIVGEIQDEFDEDEIPEIQKTGENRYIIDAKMLIHDVNQLLGTDLEEQEIDTIGGWFLTRNFEAEKGSEVESAGYLFKVHDSRGRQISYLEVKKVE